MTSHSSIPSATLASSHVHAFNFVFICAVISTQTSPGEDEQLQLISVKGFTLKFVEEEKQNNMCIRDELVIHQMFLLLKGGSQINDENRSTNTEM